MIVNDRKIDIVSNNIANVSTTGYKKDLAIQESFRENLLRKVNGSIRKTPEQRILTTQRIGDVYELSAQGGYIRVQTPEGISYHREARFAVGEDGYLKTFINDRGNIDTDYGYYALGDNGPIYVGDGELTFGDRGEVIIDGEIVDNLITTVNPYVIGTISAGTMLQRIETNFTQGQIIETANPLDLAINGEGFFVVDTGAGIRFTRDGSFKLNSNMELVTSEGYIVLGRYGPIVLDGKDISINTRGEIFVDGEYIDTLDIINIRNLRDLRKTGDGLFMIEEGIEIEADEFTGEILQGKLEQSNVDTIKEMVEMINLYRNYESNQRVIQAYDQILDKVINDLGRI